MTAKRRVPDHVLSDDHIILDLLKKLNQTERNILGLYYYENLTVDAIAQLMEIPQDTVNISLSSVINRIREEIKGEQAVHVQKTEKEQTKIWNSTPSTGPLC